MARIFNPDPKLLKQRADILEEIRLKYGLEKLLDYGYNPQLNELIDFPQLQFIEIDPDVVAEGIITGDYLTELPKHLTDNTCYTCFVFLNPPGKIVVDEGKFKTQFAEIRTLLMNASLVNSFMVLWIRSRGFQDFRVYDLEKNLDITDNFASLA